MEEETVKLVLTAKDWLEISYYICGFGLLLAVLIQAFRMKEQLEQDKNISMVNSQRESIKLAVEIIEKFSKETIPLYNLINDSLEKNKYSFPFLMITTNGMEINSSKLTENERVNNQNAIKEVETDLTKLHNHLHVFTILFEEKIKLSESRNIQYISIVNEEVGFSSLGKLYVNYMELLMCTSNHKQYIKKDTKKYSLYFSWKKRLKETIK